MQGYDCYHEYNDIITIVRMHEPVHHSSHEVLTAAKNQFRVLGIVDQRTWSTHHHENDKAEERKDGGSQES